MKNGRSAFLEALKRVEVIVPNALELRAVVSETAEDDSKNIQSRFRRMQFVTILKSIIIREMCQTHKELASEANRARLGWP